jgi:hypothetical protein
MTKDRVITKKAVATRFWLDRQKITLRPQDGDDSQI